MGRGKKALTIDKLPYGGTDVPVATSREQIQGLLIKAGADGIQWSDVYKPRRMAQLQFIRNQHRFKLTVPIHTEDLEKQRHYISDYDWERYIGKREAAMYRAMFYYLQGLIKAEVHGLLSFEEAFVGHGVVYLPGGEETTVADAIITRHLEPGRALPGPASPGKEFAEARQV